MQSSKSSCYQGEKTASGKTIDYQWRCHIDAASKRPFKVERWTQEPQQSEYELVATIEVTYPTKDQIHEVIDQIGL